MRSYIKLLTAISAALVLAACGAKTAGAGTGEEIGMGKANAPVKVIEYASASCSHCADFNNTVFPDLKTKYIDTGVVYYELREMTTAPHNFAAAAFLTARCAGKDKYYTVLDAVYRNQRDILMSGNFAGGLRDIALSAGLSEDKWRQCVEDEGSQKALQERMKRYNKEAEITGTPTFYINGKKFEGRDLSLASISAAIDAAKAGK